MTDSARTAVPCWIYRSSKKDEMYLYLAKPDAFEGVPAPLMKRFGTPQLVMELELHPGRTLARADVNTVLSHLDHPGYHLQMPPNLVPDLYDGETI